MYLSPLGSLIARTSILPFTLVPSSAGIYFKLSEPWVHGSCMNNWGISLSWDVVQTPSSLCHPLSTVENCSSSKRLQPLHRIFKQHPLIWLHIKVVFAPGSYLWIRQSCSDWRALFQEFFYHVVYTVPSFTDTLDPFVLKCVHLLLFNFSFVLYSFATTCSAYSSTGAGLFQSIVYIVVCKYFLLLLKLSLWSDSRIRHRLTEKITNQSEPREVSEKCQSCSCIRCWQSPSLAQSILGSAPPPCRACSHLVR